MESIRVVPR
ncbi:Protein of unknown function [Bacillus wiedmannii]|nr:Protein of unknown function [Bacillus wiedmannii]